MPISDYSRYDALGLAELVRTGQTSPRELVDAAIERIESLNPRLNAVVHKMFERARRTADGNLPDGPFRGVPFLLKDLLSWFEGEPITSGSRLFRDFIAPHDTEIVKRYRRAGVIVVGKTNTPEFGLVPYTEPELFGPCRNPWDVSRTPGGSSGGSAAAVASGMVPMAGGGDGGGSIRIPAGCCGVFGLKPTRGRTPTGPLHGDIWRGAVVEHVITRSVRDSAAMLDAIAGPDVGAPYYATPPDVPFLRAVATPPGRLKIAFSVAPMLGHSVHPDCQRAVRDAARLLESLGHDVEEANLPVDRATFNKAFLTQVCAESRAELEDAKALLGRNPTRRDVEPATWALVLIGGAISAGDYAAAVRLLQRAGRRIGEFFERYAILVTPTVATPPFPIGALQPPPGERLAIKIIGALGSGRVLQAAGALDKAADTVFDWMAFTPVANVTGQPAMSLPLAKSSEGLPVGVDFLGRYGDEATLFRLAAQLEQAAPWKDQHPPVWK
jgi:amidase